MLGNKFFAAILIFEQISRLRSSSPMKIETKECITGKDYRQDCNRCWCVNDGNILVCDKMDCKAVPRKMWAKVKLRKITEKDRGLLIGAALLTYEILDATGAVDEAKHYIKVKVLPYVWREVKQVAQTAAKAIKKAAKTVGNAFKNAWHTFRGWFG